MWEKLREYGDENMIPGEIFEPLQDAPKKYMNCWYVINCIKKTNNFKIQECWIFEISLGEFIWNLQDDGLKKTFNGLEENGFFEITESTQQSFKMFEINDYQNQL